MTALRATHRAATLALAGFLSTSCQVASDGPTEPHAATTTSAAAMVDGPNLIANPSFEAGTTGAPTNWSQSYWGSTAPTFSYPVSGRTSARAVKIAYSRTSTGDGRWQPQAISVTPGATYAYSEWYKASVSTQVNVEYTSTSGVRSYGWLANAASSTAWRQLTVSFVIPAGVAKVAVYHLLARAGSLTVDDVSLTTAVTPPTPATVSLLATPGAVTPGTPVTLSWTSSNATSCSASGAWTGSQALSGSTTVSPSVTSTYTLTCIGTGGSGSSSTTVTVSTTPPPTSFAEGLVTLSFDDSWLSQYANGVAVLQAAGIKATFCLCSTPLLESWGGFMTNAQAVDLAAKGHEIAAHTLTHPDLTTLTQQEVDAQLRDSRTYLQNLTGTPVTSFAYPYGAFNAGTKVSVAAAGYTSGRTVIEDSQNTPLTDKYELRSSTFLQTQTIAQIKAQINLARTNRTWFILTIHEINDGGDIYFNSVARLSEVVNYIKLTGVKVVTVKEGRALMAP